MRIEQKQVFIAGDGKEFKTEEECLKYEQALSEITDITAFLKRIKEICHKQKNCDSCIFYGNGTYECIFRDRVPNDWELERMGMKNDN